MNELGESLTG